MTLITPDERVSEMAELLRSLKKSVRNLRQQAEDLRTRIEAGEDAEIANGSKQVTQVDGLIRTCQKAEVNLAEYHNKQVGIAQGGYALDLEQARSEVGCRLARLRTCRGT
jgi:phage shock protein A